MALAVARDPGGLREVDDPVGFGDEGGFELGRRPLEGTGRALGAKGLMELLGLGAYVGDGLVNDAAIRTQKDTPPKESCALRGVLRVGDYAHAGASSSSPRTGQSLGPFRDDAVRQGKLLLERCGALGLAAVGPAAARGVVQANAVVANVGQASNRDREARRRPPTRR